MLAATLAAAGSELVDDDPDVEIAPAGGLRGDARVGVIVLDVSRPSASRFAQIASRVLGSFALRHRAAAAARAAVARGYAQTEILLWEVDETLRLPRGVTALRLDPKALLPIGALVIARNAGRPAETLLDAAARSASAASGTSCHGGTVLLRQAGIVSLESGGVLRVGVGSGASHLREQRAALELLLAAEPEPVVTQRVPWLIAHGEIGLAAWSLERRLPGSVWARALEQKIVADSLDFLVALFAAGGSSEPRAAPAQDAEAVARFCRADERSRLLELGRLVSKRVASLRVGFAHGDFWLENLLVERGRLSGVIDWQSAAPGRLPFLDLLHLQVTADARRRRQHLGKSIVDYLLPWARRGGDDVAAAYASRLALELNAKLLEALVVAYWLDYVARQLESYADRADENWLQPNVRLVLSALASQRAGA